MTELQCGYEDECINKACVNCPRKYTLDIIITEAEMVCIENMGVCDIPMFIEEKLKEFDLLQDVMRKLTKKIFKATEDKPNV